MRHRTDFQVACLKDEFSKLSRHGYVYYPTPHAIEGTGIIERGLLSQQNRWRASHPWTNRHGDAWLRREYAQRCSGRGGYHRIRYAEASAEWRDIHEGLIVHDSRSRLAACHHPVDGQHSQLSRRKTKAALQCSPIADMLWHVFYLTLNVSVFVSDFPDPAFKWISTVC